MLHDLYDKASIRFDAAMSTPLTSTAQVQVINAKLEREKNYVPEELDRFQKILLASPTKDQATAHAWVIIGLTIATFIGMGIAQYV